MKQDIYKETPQDTQAPGKIRGEYSIIKGLIAIQYDLALKDESEEMKKDINDFLMMIFENYDKKFKDDDFVEYDPLIIHIKKVEKPKRKGK